MTRCLMLDVDGVVVNGRPGDGASWASDIAGDLGVDPARLQAVFFAPHWNDIVTGRKALEAVLDACLPDLAPGLSAQAFMDYWFSRDAALDEALLADCATLRAKGIRVWLATNQEHLRARYLMETLGLRDHVEGMIYSAQIGTRKPERTFFDAAARLSGTAAQEILLVDDTPANVEAARKAGWRAAHWMPGARLTDLLEEREAGRP